MLYQFLADKYPNGISFDPMSLKLICAELSVEEDVLLALQKGMFCIKDRWYCKQMIINQEQWQEFETLTQEMLTQAGYFSISNLFDKTRNSLTNISTIQEYATFLHHIGFTIEVWQDIYFCLSSQSHISVYIEKAAETISSIIEENGGLVREAQILEELNNLDSQTVERICKRLLNNIYVRELNGIRCIGDAFSFYLPENFSKEITLIIDRLFTLGKRITASTLEFALEMAYGIHFLKEYDITDEVLFVQLCAQYYEGEHHLCLSANGKEIKEKALSDKTKRDTATKNADFLRFMTFKGRGIPIGASLVFSQDASISCTVADENDLVFYQNQTLSLTTLASSLLGKTVSTGFFFFTYEDKLLLNPLKTVIGLNNNIIDTEFWESQQKAGADPQIKEWSIRHKSGVSFEKIAQEVGKTPNSIKQRIMYHERFFKICDRNGLDSSYIIEQYNIAHNTKIFTPNNALDLCLLLPWTLVHIFSA